MDLSLVVDGHFQGEESHLEVFVELLRHEVESEASEGFGDQRHSVYLILKAGEVVLEPLAVFLRSVDFFVGRLDWFLAGDESRDDSDDAWTDAVLGKQEHLELVYANDLVKIVRIMDRVEKPLAFRFEKLDADSN